MKLYPHQEKAVERLKNGSVLVGGVGSGKSLTALYYYHTKVCGGSFQPYRARKIKKKLYIITTARKRDTGDWEDEMTPFLIKDAVVDSWNNIGKYIDARDSFFIFDEQRLVSYGAWSKAFIRITRQNQWILLSATPADCWYDLLTVFIAHGFVKDKTDFHNKYCVFSRFSKFPKIERYVSEQELARFRSKIFVIMKDQRQTKRHYKRIFTEYDRSLYNFVVKERKNPFNVDENTGLPQPCMDMGEVCRVLRQIVGQDSDKLVALWNVYQEFPKIIVFYNYDYELEMLQKWCEHEKIPYSEWNGHKHQEVLEGEKWVYLVQYSAGQEAWNCITTNCIVFLSPNYSYKSMEQASGRIDRMNTGYTDLYYYIFLTNSTIDKAIWDAVGRKKRFQEKDFVI